MFNTKKAPFDNPKVRQAFFYAIDTEKLISNQMAGHADLVEGFLPKTHENFHKASTVYTYALRRPRACSPRPAWKKPRVYHGDPITTGSRGPPPRFKTTSRRSA